MLSLGKRIDEGIGFFDLFFAQSAELIVAPCFDLTLAEFIEGRGFQSRDSLCINGLDQFWLEGGEFIAFEGFELASR